MIKKVVILPKAKKDLRGIPSYLRKKFRTWVESVELQGLEEVKKIPGYHDHPLKGGRQGQRAISLNDQYRAVYEVKGNEVEFAEVQEVNKHDY
ncbi:MAG: type II toxin-antitoxin system mRNA interferase toxin, RelE/StbE family [Deltaproteobacteria bacterium]|nr:type II toxin-antitoxin system mRNA interferase toxin, RelE/StbE family [Deltaproteobacteria bacterium]